MSDRVSPVDIEAIRRDHIQQRGTEDDPRCSYCSEVFPCSSLALCDEVKRLAERNGAVAGKNAALAAYDLVAAERDEARAAFETARGEAESAISRNLELRAALAAMTEERDRFEALLAIADRAIETLEISNADDKLREQLQAMTEERDKWKRIVTETDSFEEVMLRQLVSEVVEWCDSDDEATSQPERIANVYEFFQPWAERAREALGITHGD